MSQRYFEHRADFAKIFKFKANGANMKESFDSSVPPPPPGIGSPIPCPPPFPAGHCMFEEKQILCEHAAGFAYLKVVKVKAH
jgi:hypothetical protein